MIVGGILLISCEVKILMQKYFSLEGLAVSQRHTYMFSAGDDKQVKCWDLEQNKVRTSI